MNTGFKLGDWVTHEKLYDHKETMKVVGIRENELELEGDYSGGTHNVCQKDWLPIVGVKKVKIPKDPPKPNRRQEFG